MTKYLAGTAFALCLTASAALAEGWTLNADQSRLAFGSVKDSFNGEVHSFEGLTGTVSDDGAVAIEIPLAGVTTNIDIRDERMREFLFNNTPTATLSAMLDMDALSTMQPGDTTTMELASVLSLLGNDVDVSTEIFAARLSDRSVLVTTNDMLFLNTDQLDIDAGIDKLQELASLDSITRAIPVTVRFIFEQ
ncbi:YceI family protein [Roseovarius sp. S1116L3]|uniref:YceI family protein n=1 Tax=Roseovarius roseus TaxID=3342636 RepID=UPI003728313E